MKTVCYFIIVLLCTGPAYSQKKMNVLFIASDDLTISLASFGKGLVKTRLPQKNLGSISYSVLLS